MIDLPPRKLVSVALDHVEIEALLTGLVLTNVAIMDRQVRKIDADLAVQRSRSLISKLELAQRALAAQ